MERLAQHDADILLTGILLPEMWGFDLLDRVKESDLRTEVVLLTGSYSFDLAVTHHQARRRVDSLIDYIRSCWAALIIG